MQYEKRYDMNTTITTSEPEGSDVAWYVVPIFLATSLYMAAALFTWPYARPLMSLWLLLLAIFIPPFFPVLLIFIVARLICYPPSVRSDADVIIVVDTSRSRPRMVVDPRVRRGSSAL